ncbi:MAG: AAA family ATPase, partial [Vicinamibacterales bacterium]
MFDRGNAPRPNGNPTPVLVGRSRERALLDAHLTRSVAGSGRLVLVRGKAGVGKTALVNDLARHAAEQATQVLTGHCYDQTIIRPFGPWIEVVRGYEAQLAGSTTADEPAPEILRQLWAHEQPAAASQLALFESVLSFLTGVTQRRPLCLVLEDLHWSDQSSIDLLRFVGRQ